MTSRARPPSTSATLDQLWSPAGARNVAGISYQIAVTAYLLVSGRAGSLPFTAVTPEGLEDIDCRGPAGEQTFIQAKERGEGRDYLTRGVFAQASKRATPFLEASPNSRFVVVTDAEPGAGLIETGWEVSLAERLTPAEEDELQTSIDRSNRHLLDRQHLVVLPWNLAPETLASLEHIYNVAPSVARLLYSRLLEDLIAVASAQRHSPPGGLSFRTLGDLDALARHVIEQVDLDALDTAVVSGLLEPIDFLSRDALLPEQFLAGVDVHPSHVAAGLDLPRPTELDAITTALRETRHALILGPSGSGKSALLWRTAREVGTYMRCFRVLKLQVEDVPVLLRWVRAQQPSREMPILLCIDNLGRPGLDGWKSAASEMVAMSGLFLVGACRQEDFSTDLAVGRTRVVEPSLDEALAFALAQTLAARGIEVQVAAEEAFPKSGGLLMEYLSLLVTGHRIGQVIDEQVDARLPPSRQLEREALRYVCTAHVLGLSLGGDSLARLLSDADLAQALGVLKDEHLITTDNQEQWIGLHQLRSQIIMRRLHEIPPPSEGETVANLFLEMAWDDRVELVRRYAEEPTVSIEPLTDRAARVIADETTHSSEVTKLLEALGDADALIYAQQAIRRAREMDPTPHDMYARLMLAYTMRFAAIQWPMDLPQVRQLAEALPNRSHPSRLLVAESISPSRLAQLLKDGDGLQTADLLEALEGHVIPLQAAEWRSVWRRHQHEDIGVRARIASGIASVGGIEESRVDGILGSFDERIRELAASVINCVAVAATSESDGLVVGAQMLVPFAADAHAQAVDTARLIFDYFPEADIAQIRTLDADGNPHAYGGTRFADKRIPRGNLPRPAVNQANAKFLDSVRKLQAARFWTWRLRAESEVSRALARLIESVPQRLMNLHDNAGRRADWVRDVHTLKGAAGSIPEVPGIAIGRDTPDPTKEGLDLAAVALQQVANALTDDSPNWLGPATHLRQASDSLRTASREDAPVLVSIGDPVPEELIDSLETAADLLIVLNERAISDSRQGHDWAAAGRAIDASRESVLLSEHSALRQALADDAIGLVRSTHKDPKDLHLGRDRWVCLFPPRLWEARNRLLQIPLQLQSQLAFRTYALLEGREGVIPVAAGRLGLDQLWPVEKDDVIELADQADLAIMPTPTVDLVNQMTSALAEVSRIAALARLRRASGLPWSIAGATSFLEEAQASAQALPPEVRLGCDELIGQVRLELSEGFTSLGFAAQVVQGFRDAVVGPSLEAANALIAMAAEADMQAAGSTRA